MKTQDNCSVGWLKIKIVTCYKEQIKKIWIQYYIYMKDFPQPYKNLTKFFIKLIYLNNISKYIAHKMHMLSLYTWLIYTFI